MENDQKLVWINMALQGESKYKQEVKEYQQVNPKFAPTPYRPILTKKDILTKVNFGKPLKPPVSGYGLFSQIMLRSDSVKMVPTTERMSLIGSRWKRLSDIEKRHYCDRRKEMVDEYKRQQEAPEKVVFEGKPKLPPRSSYHLFRQNYEEEKAAQLAWQNLSKEEKNNLRRMVDSIKKEYIVAFESFLRKLPPEKLKLFSDMRDRRKESSETIDEDSESDSSECTCDSD